MKGRREALIKALGAVQARIEEHDHVEQALRGRAREQLDSMPRALEASRRHMEPADNLLIHRHRKVLLTEQQRLMRLAAGAQPDDE